MVRYRQELFFGCYADPDALPEVHELPALLKGELEGLASAASEPGRGRRERPAPASSNGHSNGRPLVPTG
jgi:hypothetical protein